MPFTQFTNLDFDQIKTSIKDYLRANSTFTDFDFEGSNFSVLIDTLAYNTYITAFNSNMVVNESFLDSATVRENVVSLARNIGYVPYSRNAASAIVSFSVTVDPDQILQDGTPVYTSSITLQAGLVCTGLIKGSSYVFSIPENITVPVVNGVATFDNITIREGTFLTKKFTVDASLDQKFILDNPFIDTSTIRVYVKGVSDSGLGALYSLVDNIFNINSSSEIFLVQEVQDEKYQLLFGDGFFGKKLENSAVITANYIVTSGKDGNGAESFSFAGSFRDADDNIVVPTNNTITITTIQNAQNGSDIETLDSIRYFAPRLYSSQYRAVTASDYETIIKSKIYGNAESVSVVGGEELDPPEYGSVLISIKPKNGSFVSDFDKEQILSKLTQYSVSGIRPRIIDIKILYVEIESYVYYNYNQVGSVSDLKTRVINSLNKYSQSVDLNRFGGRFKYSKLLQVIDNTDTSITSNITRVVMRRDLKALINRPAQYEICFGNQFHVNESGYNIKSTGFKILNDPDTVYLTDTPNADGITGVISIVKPVGTTEAPSNTPLTPYVIVQSAGVVNYLNGEITLNTITITSTDLENDLIEIQAYPESNDVVGLKDLYVSFNVSKSQINMVKDTIASGEDISGVTFTKNSYRSSYSNGKLMRS